MTELTSAAVAAKTAVSSVAPVPAVRTESSRMVTRSARAPGSIRPASGKPSERWPLAVAAASSSAEDQVPAALGGESFVELDRPHLLEQVDHRVAVRAQGERRAGVPQGGGRADAVGQVAFGGRAETRIRRGAAEQADVDAGQVGRVHGAGPSGEEPGLVQQLRRGPPVRRRGRPRSRRPARRGGRAAARPATPRQRSGAGRAEHRERSAPRHRPPRRRHPSARPPEPPRRRPSRRRTVAAHRPAAARCRRPGSRCPAA